MEFGCKLLRGHRVLDGILTDLVSRTPMVSAEEVFGSPEIRSIFDIQTVLAKPAPEPVPEPVVAPPPKPPVSVDDAVPEEPMVGVDMESQGHVPPEKPQQARPVFG